MSCPTTPKRKASSPPPWAPNAPKRRRNLALHADDPCPDCAHGTVVVIAYEPDAAPRYAWCSVGCGRLDRLCAVGPARALCATPVRDHDRPSLPDTPPRAPDGVPFRPVSWRGPALRRAAAPPTPVSPHSEPVWDMWTQTAGDVLLGFFHAAELHACLEPC